MATVAIVRQESEERERGYCTSSRGVEPVILEKLSHRNVAKFIAAEAEDSYEHRMRGIYDRTTLEYLFSGGHAVKPTIPISETEILLQIAEGLHYIHSQGVVHANVTPANIRISGSTVIIGGFEFGKIMAEDGTFIFDKFGEDSYLAPEVLTAIYESETKPAKDLPGESLFRMSKKIDLFAAGCTFFYVLTDGCHPFGLTRFTIPHNIMNSNQVNKRMLRPDHPLWGMVQCMMRKNQEDRPDLDGEVIDWLRKVLQCENDNELLNWMELWFTAYLSEPKRMTYDTSKRIGATNRRIGGQVFAGTWLWDDVAVKRIFKNELPNGPYASIDKLIGLSHDNVLGLFHTKMDENFMYLGIELCAASLRDYFRGDYKGDVPSKEDGFKQMASGLEYIHAQGLIHGAVRPSNVLISRATPAVLKLSDFGFRRPDGVTKSNSNGDGKFSKEFYLAPELLRNYDANSRGEKLFPADELCDVFSLGCVFYTYVTNGDHPFLEMDQSIFFITPNIIAGRMSLHGLDENNQDRQLIRNMLQERQKRIQLTEVIRRLNQ